MATSSGTNVVDAKEATRKDEDGSPGGSTMAPSLPAFPSASNVPWECSYGRDKRDVITYDWLQAHVFGSIRDTVRWCMERGLLARHADCPLCGGPMTLSSTGSKGNWSKDGLVWACRRYSDGKRHQRYKSIRSKSWFGKCNLTIVEILKLTYHWAQDRTQADCQREYGFSSRTTVDWYNFCREVCVNSDQGRSEMIGGDGVIVEIDESKFGKHKYHKGRYVEGQWVFGGVERGARHRIFMVPVEKRDAETLMRLIRQWILPGTTIISDCWAAYNGIDDDPNYTHLTVNHAQNYKDPVTGAHTNTIESAWNHAKRSLNKYGTDRSFLDSYLCEHIWRTKLSLRGGDAFDQFLREIAKQYPLEGGVTRFTIRIMAQGNQNVYNPRGGIQVGAIGTFNNLSDATEKKREKTEGTVMSFGNGATAVLMLAGGGEGSGVFKKDVMLMKKLLTGEHIGIEDDHIFNIYPIPDTETTASSAIQTEIRKIRGTLKGSSDGLFIFYYSGHFRTDNNFVLNNTNNDEKDLSSDEELAKLLKTIPAKHMLLILDMCYSGQAKMGAKDGGESLGDSCPQKVPGPPRLFEFLLDTDWMSKGEVGVPAGPGPEKVVQWSSSSTTQSFYDTKEGNSIFTRAIFDEITTKDSNLCKHVGSGNYASVFRVNTQIVPKIIKKQTGSGKKRQDPQTPAILPDYAREEAYFIGFPYFAKIK